MVEFVVVLTREFLAQAFPCPSEDSDAPTPPGGYQNIESFNSEDALEGLLGAINVSSRTCVVEALPRSCDSFCGGCPAKSRLDCLEPRKPCFVSGLKLLRGLTICQVKPDKFFFKASCLSLLLTTILQLFGCSAEH